MKNTYSLKKNYDFKYVYNNGRFKSDRNFVMYVCNNGESFNRLGITVSKKVGNSVVRHRIKRLVKESYRLKENNYTSGIDIVVLARKDSGDISFDIVDKSIYHLGKRLGIFIE